MRDLKPILSQLHKNLNILREREAKYADNAPLDLLNQIADHQKAIAFTEQVIAGEITEGEWQETLRPLLVNIRDRSQAQPDVCGVSIGDVEGGIMASIIAGGDVTNTQLAHGSYIAQATHGGKAEVNISTYDQQGQQVETQYNAGRDIHIHTGESDPPDPAALAAAEQRYRAALKAMFAAEAAAYIPLAGEAIETTDPKLRQKLSPWAAQRLRQRAGAEYAKLVQQGQEVKPIKLNTLREAVDQYDCIILLGAPGSGKTTSLEHLAYQLADEPDRIPLPLRLSEFGPGQSLDDFIRRGWGGAASAGYWDAPLLAGQLDTYLAAGNLFILFDALNEMPQQGCRQRAAELRRFIDRWAEAGNRFMVTCRVLDYGEELTGLQRVEVLPFSDEQIKTLLQNELPEDWQALWAVLTRGKTRSKHRQPLIELARNPYLLTMMIDVYAVEGELGRNRTELMQRFTTILLEWAKAKVPPEQWIKTEAQQRALAALAFEMQVKAGSGARVDVADVVDALPHEVKPGPAWPNEPTPPDRILTLAASANLIEMPVDRSTVRFYHQLLQEYFTTRYIVENKRYSKLMEHLTDDRWREVFFLTVSLPGEADDFFRAFRRAVDKIVASDPALTEMLAWANAKGAVASSRNAAAVRTFYIFLARAFALARDFGHSYDHLLYARHPCKLARDFDTAYAYAHAHVLGLALACDLGLAPALAHGLAQRSVLVRDLTLARSLGLGLGPAVDYLLTVALVGTESIEHFYPVPIDKIHAQISSLVAYFKHMAQEAGHISPALAATLAAITVPAESAPKSAWKAFNTQLRQLMTEHRDLGHNWNLSEAQVDTLAAYLQANRFLLQCLDVTYMNDREAIKDSLLLPPGEWEF